MVYVDGFAESARTPRRLSREDAAVRITPRVPAILPDIDPTMRGREHSGCTPVANRRTYDTSVLSGACIRAHTALRHAPLTAYSRGPLSRALVRYLSGAFAPSPSSPSASLPDAWNYRRYFALRYLLYIASRTIGTSARRARKGIRRYGEINFHPPAADYNR